jgi:large subunit ribosomal protein L6
MSRIGKMPVIIPAKVQVTINGQEIKVKGPKGELAWVMPEGMTLEQADGKLTIQRASEERHHRELHGLTRALIHNMVTGVSTGFRKMLIIEGVGYRAELKGKDLIMYLGYSHPIEIKPEPNITFTLGEKGQSLFIDGIDKARVGQVAADLRALRPPEPYKGKGVRYDKEVIRRKAGKAGKGK